MFETESLKSTELYEYSEHFLCIVQENDSSSNLTILDFLKNYHFTHPKKLSLLPPSLPHTYTDSHAHIHTRTPHHHAPAEELSAAAQEDLDLVVFDRVAADGEGDE